MQLLVVAATAPELRAAQQCAGRAPGVDFALTGVGVLPTAHALTRLLAQKKYDWVLNVGLAGTLSEGVLPGEAVVVARELLGESGVERAAGVIAPFPPALQCGVGLVCPYVNDFPFLQRVKKATGLTVSLLTESPARVVLRKTLYGADVETMEGAAFFYVCLREKVNFLQLRGISNVVGERNKAKWKTGDALAAVGELLKKVAIELKL